MLCFIAIFHGIWYSVVDNSRQLQSSCADVYHKQVHYADFTSSRHFLPTTAVALLSMRSRHVSILCWFNMHSAEGGSCWKPVHPIIQLPVKNTSQDVDGHTLARGCVETTKVGCHHDHTHMTNCFCSQTLCNAGVTRTLFKAMISLPVILALTRTAKCSR